MKKYHKPIGNYSIRFVSLTYVLPPDKFKNVNRVLMNEALNIVPDNDQ